MSIPSVKIWYIGATEMGGGVEMQAVEAAEGTGVFHYVG